MRGEAFRVGATLPLESNRAARYSKVLDLHAGFGNLPVQVTLRVRSHGSTDVIHRLIHHKGWTGLEFLSNGSSARFPTSMICYNLLGRRREADTVPGCTTLVYVISGPGRLKPSPHQYTHLTCGCCSYRVTFWIYYSAY